MASRGFLGITDRYGVMMECGKLVNNAHLKNKHLILDKSFDFQ